MILKILIHIVGILFTFLFWFIVMGKINELSNYYNLFEKDPFNLNHLILYTIVSYVLLYIVFVTYEF